MHCERYTELLSGFVDGQLTEGQTDTVLTHLGECDSCRNDLETLFAIGDGLRHGGVFGDSPEPSSDFVARVMEQLPAAPAMERPVERQPSIVSRYVNAFVDSLRLRPALAGAAAMAVFLLTIAGSSFIYSTFSKPELMQVSELKPLSSSSVADPEEREFYNHTRLDAAYTVGGTPFQMSHPLQERF